SADPPNRPGTGEARGEWEPPVLRIVATRGEGVDALVAAVERHAGHLQTTGELGRRRRARLERLTREVVERSMRQLVWTRQQGESVLHEGLDDVVHGVRSPYDLARDIVSIVTDGSHHESG
ncbi:MAG TPA: hypothetical protein VNL18_05550, partial [Gemmatimonadales bacterium]|nr:hypothetical protein [Gemmatimonadales bacterium]